MGKVGLIGVGLMGEPIAIRLLHAGFEVHVWNRTAEKCKNVQNCGAIVEDNPLKIAAAVDIVLLILKDETAVSDVIFGENGLSAVKNKELIIVDHSTISPLSVSDLVGKLSQTDLKYLDAPVTGSIQGAVTGSLVAYIGGEKTIFKMVSPVLSAYIKHQNFMGKVGLGHATKICNQTILLNMIMGIFEMVSLSRAIGLDGENLINAFDENLFDSKAWRIYGHAQLLNKKEHLAPIKNVFKDLNYIRELGRSLQCPTYLTDRSASMVEGMIEAGLGDADLLELIQIFQSH